MLRQRVEQPNAVREEAGDVFEGSSPKEGAGAGEEDVAGELNAAQPASGMVEAKRLAWVCRLAAWIAGALWPDATQAWEWHVCFHASNVCRHAWRSFCMHACLHLCLQMCLRCLAYKS